MLKKIGLKNFKAFKDLKNLDIKPITVFCGENSCGKSSLLQSILLMKQSLESQDPYRSFLINGRFVHQGSFDNLIYGSDREQEIVFDFSFSITPGAVYTKPTEGSYPLIIPLSYLTGRFKRESYSSPININYRFSLKANERDKQDYLLAFEISSLEIKASMPNDVGNYVNTEVAIKHKELDQFNVKWKNLKTSAKKQSAGNYSSSNAVCTLHFQNLNQISQIFKTISAFGVSTDAIRFANRVGDVVRSMLDTYTYIGPLREKPSRRYVYENEVREIGQRGENAAYLYLVEKNKHIGSHYYFDTTNNTYTLSYDLTLESAVDNWLSQMGISGFKPTFKAETITLSMDAGDEKDTQVSIADVGFGVSQIFPIVLEGLRLSKHCTLLLEQPEIHLHPNLQMQMADFLIAMALSGKNIIVETHSDHVVNRMVRRMVEDKEHNLSDMIAIYYIRRSDAGSFAEKIQIDENRGIVNWPKGFFDQVASEQEQIIMAGINKRQS